MTPTDLAGIAEYLSALPDREERYLIAIAGPPASGKSTFAQELVHLVEGSAVVPMDGFHLSNEELIGADMLARKGAPETFDVLGFRALLSRLNSRTDIAYPTFDRTADSVVPGGGILLAETRIALIEGNYLLLNEGHWAGLDWDVSIWLDVPPGVLEIRLMSRWLNEGMSIEEAKRKTKSNDLPNGHRVIANSVAADFAITTSA